MPVSMSNIRELGEFEDCLKGGFHLRITDTEDKWTDDTPGQILEVLKECDIDVAIGQVEGDGGLKRKHIHIYGSKSRTLDDKKVQDKIKSKGLMGNGNKSFSWTQIKNAFKVAKYVSKDIVDGIPLGYGVDPDLLETFKKSSFKKENKEMVKELERLELDYLKDDIKSHRTFCVEYIKLKIKYGHNLNKTQIKSYLDKMKLKKDPGQIIPWIQENIDGFYSR